MTAPENRNAAKRLEKVADRVVTPDGTKGVIALVHPTIGGAVFVQPVAHDMTVYMRGELTLDDA